MEVNLSDSKEKQQSFSVPPSRIKQEGSKFNCYDCKTTFSRFFGLKRHMNKQHPNKYKQFLTSFYEDYKYKCNLCSQRYNDAQKLKKHEKRMHGISEINSSILHKCSLCQGKFDKKLIHSHFQTEHGLVLKTEVLVFKCYEEFSKWKLDIEKEAKCFFRKKGGKHIGDSSYHYFTCNRSGFFKSEGKGVRRLKLTGSKRMGAFCPAMIKLCQKKDECKVTFQSTHVGHENDAAHFIQKYEKDELDVDTKIPFEILVEEGQSSMPGEGLQGFIGITESSNTEADTSQNTVEQAKTIKEDRRKKLLKMWYDILYLINHSNSEEFHLLESSINSIELKIKTLQSHPKVLLSTQNSSGCKNIKQSVFL